MEYIKLRFEQPKFKIDENHRYVKCTMSAKLIGLDDIVPGKFRRFTVEATGCPKNGVPFSESVGKRVSRAKCELKAYQEMKTRIGELMREWSEVYDEMRRSSERFEAFIESTKSYLKTF